VHIAHKYDDDNHPWPIEIEDHQGNLHAVNLEPGQVCIIDRLCYVETLMIAEFDSDYGTAIVSSEYVRVYARRLLQMLFYESAACVHGRRQKFRGKYYGSVFLHYQPVDRSIWDYTIEVRACHYGAPGGCCIFC
jgi:hypothetical protein